MTKKHSSRLLELDVLRGLAALGVMCFHYTTQYTRWFSPTEHLLFKFPLGYLLVNLFFIISGFVIFMTLEKTKHPFDFIVSRCSRLYPCYWAALLITFLTLHVLHLPGYETSFKEALINLSMFQTWFNVPHVDGVYWTLTVELSFYIVMLLIYCCGFMKHIEALGLGWLILMGWNQRWFHSYMPAWINHSMLLTTGHLFFAGILFYKLKVEGNTWYRHAALGLCFLVGYMLRKDPQDPGSLLVFFSIFYLFIYGKLSWITNKPLLYLGSISYSLYLIHQYTGYAIIHHLLAIGASAWVCFLIPASFAFLSASLITYFIEKPAMGYLRQLYKNWKEKSLTVPSVSINIPAINEGKV